MTDLSKLQASLVTAHDALVDILEAEQGDTVHYLTLPEFYQIEKMARFLRKLYDNRCRDCPECAVIFDSEGIHGHVPDRNSKTCQSCGRYKEALE